MTCELHRRQAFPREEMGAHRWGFVQLKSRAIRGVRERREEVFSGGLITP
jgi:hypothetical protein